MRLNASDLIALHRPSSCELRIFLRHAGEAQESASEFDKVLRRLGTRHEQEHLQSLGTHVDVSQTDIAERLRKTKEAVLAGASVVYQPTLQVNTVLNGIEVEIVGIPDFLIREGNGYVIRDAKLSRNITEDSHPEIILQVQLYGWLIEQMFGTPPKRLEVYSGKQELALVPYDGGVAAITELETVLRLKQLGTEPYEPVGHSKCDGCGYEHRCWNRAKANHDVSLLVDVDQGLARQLHSEGITTPAELLSRYDAQTLSELKRPRGGKMARVGAAATKILLYAEALRSNTEKVLFAPNVPAADNFVMFDLEGMPPHMNELDKIYLWGTQVFGSIPSKFMGAVAGFGPSGDGEGWHEFLANSKATFETYGDIRFVHWSAYEKTNLNKYIIRYGDPDGIGARVGANLLDLFPITKASMILPVPSYGLKTIEEYVGFKRTQDEYGGTWSMATFIEATETQDQAKRLELMGAILKYNEEDLQATWAVMEWLRTRMPLGKATSAP
jgi:uncharacterized protein